MSWRVASFDDAAKRRITEAMAFEKRIRLESLLNVKQMVGGFHLRQITPRDLLKLEFSENRLATGEEPELDDYVHLVLLLSEPIRFFKKRKITKIARSIKKSDDVKEEIQGFYLSCFNDMPSSGSSNQVIDEFDSSIYICSLVDTVCSSYSWDLDIVLDTPMLTCLQLIQRILKRRLGNEYSIKNGITQQAKAKELNKLKQHG
tara:strand:- start:947 stop:1555 length:609 start_codon:yes stop_codon:yes gene_type:complete